MNTIEKLTKELLKIKAVKLEPDNSFTFASRLRSPIYCDNRMVLSHPKIRGMAVSLLIDRIHSLPIQPKMIVGVAVAGVPYSAIVADRMNLPYGYVTLKKNHGRKKDFEGDLSILSRDDEVVVIDDLLSTGSSGIKAANIARNKGCKVSLVLSIVTYALQLAKDNFDAAGFEHDSLIDYQLLTQIGLKNNYISSKEKTLLDEWQLNPEYWTNRLVASRAD